MVKKKPVKAPKPKATALPAKEDMATNDPLAIPAFLKRDGSKRLSHEESRALVDVSSGRTRSWVMPDNSPEAQAARKAVEVERKKTQIIVANEDAPVTVSVKSDSGVKTLAVYQNMVDFRSQHDFGTYPFRESRGDKNATVILVGVKPWAGRYKKPGAIAKPAGKTKAEMIGEMLLRPEGITSKEVCQAMGWPSVSMPAQAKMCGLGLRKEKIDGVTKYWGIKQ